MCSVPRHRTNGTTGAWLATAAKINRRQRATFPATWPDTRTWTITDLGVTCPATALCGFPAWSPPVGRHIIYGRWVWVVPWGWTWVDDAPWGFAPFHYGRWVYVSYWAWVPGPLAVRPVQKEAPKKAAPKEEKKEDKKQ
jgi:hypothetical protein